MATTLSTTSRGAADAPHECGAADAWPTEVVVLRSRDRAALLRAIDGLLASLDTPRAQRLSDIAASLNTTLPPGGVRLAVVAADCADLARRLAAARERLTDSACMRLHDPSGTYFESAPLALRGEVALLFPGEGAQYLGMLRDLPAHFADVRDSLAQTDRFVGPDLGDARSVSRFFASPEDLNDAERELLEQRLRQVDFAMFSVLAADSAIGKLLDGLQLEPAAVCGHSAGELAALAAAGSIGVVTEVPPLVTAMRALGEAETKSGPAEAVLLAVAASREMLDDLLAGIPSAAFSTAEQAAFVAMDNCPHQAVVVGLPEPMTQLEAALKAQRVVCERLPFTRPYHTSLFAPFMGPLREMFDAVTFRRPQRRVYSSTTARPFPDDPEALRETALSHWSSPVEFRRLVETMYDDGIRLFVEAGPRGVLSAFVHDILRGREFAALPADLPRRSAVTQMNQLAAQLAAHHVPIDFGYFYRCRMPAGPDVASAATASSNLPRRKNGDGAAAVLARHFDVMQRFLATQQNAMRGYLRASTGRRSIGQARHTSRRAGGIGPSTTLAAAAPAAAPAPGTFPLGGTLVSHTPGVELVIHRRLDLSEDRYAFDHTVGGRDISRVNPAQRGLPVMPMTFILEMMAEAAARLVPERVVTAARDIRLQRWLAFDEEAASTVEISARRRSGPSTDGAVEVDVEVRDLGRVDFGEAAAKGAVASATVELAGDYPLAPRAAALVLTNEQPCRVTLAGLYRGLFHGPLFQGVRSLDRFGDEGLLATIEVLPRRGLFRSCDEPRFLCDPVTVDIGMHPAAGWHLEQPDQEGRILLPFELKRVEFFGPSPPVGTRLVTHNRITHAAPRQFHHCGEFIRQDGTLWCRLTDVKCWRFYLPFGEVNFNGPKDQYFVSKPWLALSPREEGGRPASTVCVRLDPSGDMAQSAMQEAAARISLSEDELRAFRQLRRSGEQRTAWLFGRIAVKDAARLWLHDQTGVRHFTADLQVAIDHCGRHTIQSRDRGQSTRCPVVAVACLPRLIVALATGRSWAGVALTSIEDVDSQGVLDELPADQRRVLDKLYADAAERAARAVAARTALRSALGPALAADISLFLIRDVEGATGIVRLAIGSELASIFPDLADQCIDVRTVVEDGIVIATVVGPLVAGAP